MSRALRLPRLRLPWRPRRGDPPVGAVTPGLGAGPIPRETFRALRHRNYRLFFAGQSISLSGTWMQTVAQAWLVLQLTDSKEALGTVVMLQFLPITILVLFGGVIADRVPKRDFIVLTQSLAMLQAAALAFLVWTGWVELWHVYVLAVMLGLANAFDQPTRQAFIVEMVGKEDLLNAVALNSGLFNAARLIGPAIGGAVISAAGVKAAFTINALSFIPVITGLLMMDKSQLMTAKDGAKAPINALAEVKEGLAYALRTPAAFLIVIIAFFIGMFGYNFIVVLPLVTRYVLGRGSTELGFLNAALGLGALVSALFLAGSRRAARPVMFTGGALFAVLLAAVGLSRWFPVTLLALLLLGLVNTAFSATANTSLQLSTPDHLRGRVMGIWMLLFAGSTPFGGYLTGFLAQRLGVATAVEFNAAMCGLGVALALAYYLSHRDAVELPAAHGHAI